MPESTLDILDLLRVRGTAYVNKRPSGQWSVAIDQHAHMIRFHAVLAGSAWVTLESGDHAHVQAGDLIVVPNGKRHILSSDKGLEPSESDAIPRDDIAPDMVADDGPSNAHLLCGYIQISDNAPPVLMTRLPPLLVLNGRTHEEKWKIDALFSMIEAELKAKTSSARVLLNRMTEVLCLLTFRNWLDGVVSSDQHLSDLFNSRLQLVLDEIRSNPAHNWSVAELAALYGKSRTSFATQFSEAMGVGPISFVTASRMAAAKRLLRETNLALDDVAMKCGFSDTNAFNRAFRREVGVSPGFFRSGLSRNS